MSETDVHSTSNNRSPPNSAAPSPSGQQPDAFIDEVIAEPEFLEIPTQPWAGLSVHISPLTGQRVEYENLAIKAEREGPGFVPDKNAPLEPFVFVNSQIGLSNLLVSQNHIPGVTIGVDEGGLGSTTEEGTPTAQQTEKLKTGGNIDAKEHNEDTGNEVDSQDLNVGVPAQSVSLPIRSPPVLRDSSSSGLEENKSFGHIMATKFDSSAQSAVNPSASKRSKMDAKISIKAKDIVTRVKNIPAHFKTVESKWGSTGDEIDRIMKGRHMEEMGVRDLEQMKNAVDGCDNFLQIWGSGYLKRLSDDMSKLIEMVKEKEKEKKDGETRVEEEAEAEENEEDDKGKKRAAGPIKQARPKKK